MNAAKIAFAVATVALLLPLAAIAAAIEPPKAQGIAQTQPSNEQRASDESEYFVLQDSRNAKCAIANERPMDGKLVVVGNGYKTYREAVLALRAIGLCRTD